MEDCLWVKDTIAKNARIGANQDPEVVRCRKDGTIFCKPCMEKFFGTTDETGAYSISRDLLARMVAAHTSGMFNAIPEQADFDNADAMIALLEERLRSDG